jgi:hypothetical protein
MIPCGETFGCEHANSGDQGGPDRDASVAIRVLIHRGTMKEDQKTGYSERLKTAAAAKAALLAQLRPKPTQVAAEPVDRAAERAAELETVRQARAEAKAVRKEAASHAAEVAAQAQAKVEADALEAKRGERKQRKALSAAETKARRDAKFAAYRPKR